VVQWHATIEHVLVIPSSGAFPHFPGIDRQRIQHHGQGAEIAIGAPARARVSQQHDDGGIAAPAFVLVGTRGLLAHSPKGGGFYYGGKEQKLSDLPETHAQAQPRI